MIINVFIAQVPEYERSLDLILDDVESGMSDLSCTLYYISWYLMSRYSMPPLISDDSITSEQLQAINESAEVLYGLIHARYIITAEGIERMVSPDIF
jgi:hypothetical protein